jgi:hypothetical protein
VLTHQLGAIAVDPARRCLEPYYRLKHFVFKYGAIAKVAVAATQPSAAGTARSIDLRVDDRGRNR